MNFVVNSSHGVQIFYFLYFKFISFLTKNKFRKQETLRDETLLVLNYSKTSQPSGKYIHDIDTGTIHH